MTQGPDVLAAWDPIGGLRGPVGYVGRPGLDPGTLGLSRGRTVEWVSSLPNDLFTFGDLSSQLDEMGRSLPISVASQ